MFREVTVSGAVASLRWSYHQAAALRDWTLTKVAGGFALSATITTKDTFRVSQRPLVFVVTTQDGPWRFPVQSLQIDGASLTATLGPKEKTV